MQKTTTLFFPCRSLCCFFTPNSFFSHTQQRFSHIRTGGAEPTKPQFPIYLFTVPSFSAKVSKALPKYHLTTWEGPFAAQVGSAQPPTCQSLNRSWAGIQGAEGGKEKLCPALVLEFSVWRLCPSQRVWEH